MVAARQCFIKIYRRVKVARLPSIAYCCIVFLITMLILLYINYKFQVPSNDKATNPKRQAQTHVLILSNFRSGSSFVGQILNHHPEVFYMMESTRHVWTKLPNESPTLLHVLMRDLLRSLFMCDMSALKPYLSQAKYISDLFMWQDSRALCSPPVCKAFNSSVFYHRKTCHVECFYSPFAKMEEACKTYTHIAAKVVRFLDLEVLFPLLADPQLDLKIIHLVRDPRAILSSCENINYLGTDDIILSRGTSQNASIYDVMQKICEAQIQIYKAATSDPPHFMKERYMLVRYEDLVKDPIIYMNVLYHYAGLSMSPEIESWLYNITHGIGEDDGFMPFVADSMTLAKQWRHKLSLQKINMIQDICQEQMDVFGYQKVESEKELKNQSLDLMVPMATHLFGGQKKISPLLI